MNNYYFIQNIKITNYILLGEKLLETKCSIRMFHIILGFKNEDKIYILILLVYSYFRKTEQMAIKYIRITYMLLISMNST